MIEEIDNILIIGREFRFAIPFRGDIYDVSATGRHASKDTPSGGYGQIVFTLDGDPLPPVDLGFCGRNRRSDMWHIYDPPSMDTYTDDLSAIATMPLSMKITNFGLEEVAGVLLRNYLSEE